MKILIAGLGSIGRQHLRNLITLGERDILLYRTNKSTLPEDELADFPVETDLDKALNHKPNAVIVSNPTSIHLDVAVPAAQAGCHLLLEKPVSDSLENIDELVEAVKTGGGEVLVGYQFRFHPGLRKVDELLQIGAVGQPVSVRAHWGEYLPGWHPWENYHLGYSARADLGGGVILTLSHPLDYLSWWFGDVSEVWAFSGTLGGLGVEVEDTAEIGIRFESGVIGSVHVDYLQQPSNHFLEIIGTQGTISWNYSDGGVQWYRSEEKTWQSFHIEEGFERNDMFIAEMSHFFDLVHGNDKSRCSLSDGVRALELALAAKSSSKGQKIIQLS